MAAPMDGSPGGRTARVLLRVLALASLASLAGLLLSGPAVALSPLGTAWQRPNPDPPVSRVRSLLLDAASGELRLEDGLHPDAVAWANLTNAIRETGLKDPEPNKIPAETGRQTQSPTGSRSLQSAWKPRFRLCWGSLQNLHAPTNPPCTHSQKTTASCSMGPPWVLGNTRC